MPRTFNMELLKMWEGEADSLRLGRSVAGIGDVNGDGYDDVLIGLPGIGNAVPGWAHLYFGGETLSDTADLVFVGENPRDAFGFTVSAVGDVNGDSAHDFAVSAVGFDRDRGKVYIFYGGTLLDTIPDIVLEGEGQQRLGDLFGWDVGGAGDINKDGYDDLLVTAPNYDFSRGKLYFFMGGAPMDSLPDWTVSGDTIFSYFAVSFTTGDFNDDDWLDIVVGSLGDVGEFQRAGWFSIYYGGAEMDTLPDLTVYGDEDLESLGESINSIYVNDDSYVDLVVSAGLKAFVFLGDAAFDTVPDITLGPSADVFTNITAAGDLTGDGYTELVTGTPGFFGNFGRVSIYFGGPFMDGEADYRIGGTQVSYFGDAVAGAGRTWSGARTARSWPSSRRPGITRTRTCAWRIRKRVRSAT
ncbi:MAG: FG-GAP repeat protein [Bacteroidetes bacterium]|nr:FG-GAP repeat protein [Bacteroidota bacterium]